MNDTNLIKKELKGRYMIMSVNKKIKKIINQIALYGLDKVHDKCPYLVLGNSPRIFWYKNLYKFSDISSHLLFMFLAKVFPDESTLSNYATFLFRYRCPKHIDKIKVKKIIDLYYKSLKYKTNPIAYIMLGDVYFECKEYHFSELCYKKALCFELGNKRVSVLLNLGITELYLQHFSKAYTVFRTIIESLKENDDMAMNYEGYYCFLFYSLYHMQKDDLWQERLELHIHEFKCQFPKVVHPLSFLVYYMLDDTEIICHKWEIIKRGWDIREPLFALIIDVLLENKKEREAKVFYKYCIYNNNNKSKKYKKIWNKLITYRMVNCKSHRLLKEKIIVDFIENEINVIARERFKEFYKL